jgi:hypothetical protein
MGDAASEQGGRQNVCSGLYNGFLPTVWMHDDSSQALGSVTHMMYGWSCRVLRDGLPCESFCSNRSNLLRHLTSEHCFDVPFDLACWSAVERDFGTRFQPFLPRCDPIPQAIGPPVFQGFFCSMPKCSVAFRGQDDALRHETELLHHKMEPCLVQRQGSRKPWVAVTDQVGRSVLPGSEFALQDQVPNGVLDLEESSSGGNQDAAPRMLSAWETFASRATLKGSQSHPHHARKSDVLTSPVEKWMVDAKMANPGQTLGDDVSRMALALAHVAPCLDSEPLLCALEGLLTSELPQLLKDMVRGMDGPTAISMATSLQPFSLASAAAGANAPRKNPLFVTEKTFQGYLQKLVPAFRYCVRLCMRCFPRDSKVAKSWFPADSNHPDWAQCFRNAAEEAFVHLVTESRNFWNNSGLLLRLCLHTMPSLLFTLCWVKGWVVLFMIEMMVVLSSQRLIRLAAELLCLCVVFTCCEMTVRKFCWLG